MVVASYGEVVGWVVGSMDFIQFLTCNCQKKIVYILGTLIGLKIASLGALRQDPQIRKALYPKHSPLARDPAEYNWMKKIHHMPGLAQENGFGSP